MSKSKTEVKELNDNLTKLKNESHITKQKLNEQVASLTSEYEKEIFKVKEENFHYKKIF